MDNAIQLHIQRAIDNAGERAMTTQTTTPTLQTAMVMQRATMCRTLSRFLSVFLLFTVYSESQAQEWSVSERLMSAGLDVVRAFTISEKQLAGVARQYAAQTDAQNTIAPPNNPYAQRLERLTARHQVEDGLRLNFKVYLSKTINAFALADGTVRVYSGLMDAMTDEEILGVIGHEIGHVKNNDHRDKLRTALLSSAGRKAIASAGGTVGQLAETQLGLIAENLVNAKFSRTQETDADDYGLAFLRRHGYNPQAMYTALAKLARLGGRSNLIQQMFSTHPDPQKRAERMKNLVSSPPSRKR